MLANLVWSCLRHLLQSESQRPECLSAGELSLVLSAPPLAGPERQSAGKTLTGRGEGGGRGEVVNHHHRDNISQSEKNYVKLYYCISL